MIRLPITEAAFDAIAKTLPKDRVADAERSASGKHFIWLEKAVVSQLDAMRRPGEGYSETILRLFAAEKPKQARTKR